MVLSKTPFEQACFKQACFEQACFEQACKVQNDNNKSTNKTNVALVKALEMATKQTNTKAEANAKAEADVH